MGVRIKGNHIRTAPSFGKPSGQETLFLNGAEDIFPDYTVGEDGVAFSLPANQIEIVRTSKGRQVSKG